MLDCSRVAAAAGIPRRLGFGQWTARRPATPPGVPCHAFRTEPVPAVAIVLVVALLGLARPVGAAEGIFLSWDNCGAGANANKTFACDTDDGQQVLFCEFTMPQAADSVVAVEIVIDIQHASSTLPDWWRFDEGGCRVGTILSADAEFAGTGCTDMWLGAKNDGGMVVGGFADYITSQPRGQASQARLRVALAVTTQYAVTLDGTTRYAAARVIIRNDKTAGGSGCPGCVEPACLVLNQVLIGRVAGSEDFCEQTPLPQSDFCLVTPGAVNANWATWQGGAGANCAAVPVRKRTWGEIKSLYRAQ